MMRILIVFVVIYVTFIGIALNIAKAYRIKNGVINILEQNRFNIETDTNTLLAENGKLNKYLNGIPYTVKSENIDCEKYSDGDIYNDSTGVCIIKKGDNKNVYYKVVVFMFVDFPYFDIDGLAIPVSGETMTIKDYSK